MTTAALRVTVAVPTIDSGAFIASTLDRLVAQVHACSPEHSIDLVVCVNGARGAHATVAAVERFARRSPEPPLAILREPRAGKNTAMNAILRSLRARTSPPDLVFFFDDDVVLDAGTLGRNIAALLAHEAAHGDGPVLVGAALRALPLTWQQACARHPSWLRALRAWLLHQVFVFPYRDDAPVPRFCEGMALGARLVHYPDIPDSASGVGDDTFVSNTFALRGRERWLRDGVPSLLKPPGSIGRVVVADELATWREQQVRTHAGIELSWRRFEADRAFLAEHLAWPFAFNPDSRRSYAPRGLADALRYRAYMRLHEQNRAQALALLRRGHTPAWCAGS